MINIGIISLIKLITGALFFFSSYSGTYSSNISFTKIRAFLARIERIEFINNIIFGYNFNPYKN